MNIHLETLDDQPSLEITSTVPIWKVPKTLAQSWQKIKSHMNASNVEQIGKPYAKFSDINWHSVANDGAFSQMKHLLFGKQKIAVGIRVDDETPQAGEIEITCLKSGEYIKAIHKGGVHKVGESYKQIVKWAAQQNLELENSSIEIYTHAPGEVKMSKMETILLIPIKNN